MSPRVSYFLRLMRLMNPVLWHFSPYHHPLPQLKKNLERAIIYCYLGSTQTISVGETTMILGWSDHVLKTQDKSNFEGAGLCKVK